MGTNSQPTCNRTDCIGSVDWIMGPFWCLPLAPQTFTNNSELSFLPPPPISLHLCYFPLPFLNPPSLISFSALLSFSFPLNEHSLPLSPSCKSSHSLKSIRLSHVINPKSSLPRPVLAAWNCIPHCWQIVSFEKLLEVQIFKLLEIVI